MSDERVAAASREEVVARLKSHEAELKAAGVQSISIFGSVARGEANEHSDIDLLVRLSEEIRLSGLAYFGRLEALSASMETFLSAKVDITTEPVRSARLLHEIERERILAF